MNQFRQRLAASITAAAMLTSGMAVTAWADTGDSNTAPLGDSDPVASVAVATLSSTGNTIRVNTYADLQSALGWVDEQGNELSGTAQDGDTIYIDANLTAESHFGGSKSDATTGATIVVDKSVTIEGNGKTINGNNFPTFMPTGDGVHVTINDLTIRNGAYHRQQRTGWQ